MIYVENFKFAHMPADTVAWVRSQIADTLNQLEGNTEPPITEDQRPGVERRLAALHEQHVTLQIRDTYLQVLVRMNRENGVNGWDNPWEKIDPDYFVGKSNERLLAELETQHEIRQEGKQAKRELLVARRRAAKAAEQWHRPETPTDRYQAIDGRLHEVRVQTRPDGEIVRDVSPHPVNSTRIKYRGEMLSVATVLRILTGSVAKRGRPPKGTRYRAQVRQGSRVLHLGVFDTPEERDAAVLNHRLGLGVNPAP